MRPATVRHLVLSTALLLLPAATPAISALDEPATPGALEVKQPDGTLVDMPLRHTAVSIEVAAFVARATIEQVFANPFDRPVEAVYTFPLGDRAAVDDFELVVGDRTIRGEIKRREDARATYEQARAAGYRAALLEQERPNLFTQSVANLEPGQSVTVRLRTVETLRYERGLYRLTFPLVVGPRYIPGGGRVPDAARIAPPLLAPGTRSGHDVEIAVSIDAGVPLTAIESESHRVVVEKSGATGARVRLAPDDAIPNKDFLLRWSVSAERPAVGLLAHRDGTDGFFTLLVQPKGEVSAIEAAPKEITFVVDTSGSMEGVPLEASKRLVASALHELGPRDTFNVVRFSGDNEVYSKDPLPNDRTAIDAAVAWLAQQQGGGGTEMLPALRAAFARPADPDRVRLVDFFTDGYVGNEAEILSAIGGVLGEARIYTVGIGTSVNHYLLDRMADLGHGAYVFVRPDRSADDALDAFKAWVTRPYLTDLTVDWGALPIADAQPERLRDLGSGQTLTIVGRYLSAADGSVTVRGKLGGRYWEQTVHVVLPEREMRHAALASLWARGRIEELLLGAPGATPDSVRAEVTSLALSYRLMSPFTSFVAVDDSRVVNPSGQSPTVVQALPMPDGVSFGGVFGKDGPAALQARSDAGAPEDAIASGGVAGARERDFKTQVSGVSGVDPLTGTFVNLAAHDSVEEVTVVAAGAGAEFGRAQGGFANIVRGPAAPPLAVPLPAADGVRDLPVEGRFYQSVLALSPGVMDPDGDGSPNVSAEARAKWGMGSVVDTAADARLLDAAFRVLADLADDGTLTAAEGVPALTALLAAQRPSGAIAVDVKVQAIATWAIAEAAAAMPRDPWVASARTKAVDFLAGSRSGTGWPERAGGAPDAESTRWARLVLSRLSAAAVAGTFVPGGDASPSYARLRKAIAAGRSATPTAAGSGRSPFDRLIASIGRGHLKIVKS
jgi:Ca-activated chloride channel family protein